MYLYALVFYLEFSFLSQLVSPGCYSDADRELAACLGPSGLFVLRLGTGRIIGLSAFSFLYCMLVVLSFIFSIFRAKRFDG